MDAADDWSPGARQLLTARYLRRDIRGQVVETIDDLFWRVARAVAAAESVFPGNHDEVATAERFRTAMVERRFLPNSPTLINAGTELGQLMACFVLPVPDTLDGIFTALHDGAIIQQSGGGTGFSFSRLRPAGDIVRSTRRPSSGPVPFLRVFDTMTDVIAGESVRGGANMAALRVDHPDVAAFVGAKATPGNLPHFNLSVAATDQFMERAARGESFALINPRTGTAVAEVRADQLLDEIATRAWATGDPGLLFLDRIERDNPTPSLGTLETTNPCGEVPLLPYEACCLGSVNLAAFGRRQNGEVRVDEDALAATVRTAVHFLDNVVEVSRYPLPAIAEVCHANRKIGVGVMGLADLLFDLAIPYGSTESVQLVDRLLGIVQTAAVAASRELAATRGPFPNFGLSRYRAAGEPPRRNATVTTVAPTGSISVIADCSSGIEPVYALAYRRTGVLDQVVAPHPALVAALARINRTESPLLAEIEATGRLGHRADLPESLRRLFRVAGEIPPTEHLAIQAAVQRHVENAVSKTINLPVDATVEAVREVMVGAHRLDCKGITVYREGTHTAQVLQILGRCLSCTGEDAVPHVTVRHPPENTGKEFVEAVTDYT